MRRPPIISITEKPKKTKTPELPLFSINPSKEDTKRRRGDLKHIAKAIFEVKSASSVVSNAFCVQPKLKTIEISERCHSQTSIQNIDDNASLCLRNTSCKEHDNSLDPTSPKKTISDFQNISYNPSTSELSEFQLELKEYKFSCCVEEKKKSLNFELSTQSTLQNSFGNYKDMKNNDGNESNNFYPATNKKIQDRIKKEKELKTSRSFEIGQFTEFISFSSEATKTEQLLLSPIFTKCSIPVAVSQHEMASIEIYADTPSFTHNHSTIKTSQETTLPYVKETIRKDINNTLSLETSPPSLNLFTHDPLLVSSCVTETTRVDQLNEMTNNIIDDSNFQTNKICSSSNNSVDMVNNESYYSSFEEQWEEYVNRNMLLIENETSEETIVIMQSGEERLRGEDSYGSYVYNTGKDNVKEDLFIEEKEQEGSEDENQQNEELEDNFPIQDCSPRSHPHPDNPSKPSLLYSLKIDLLISLSSLVYCFAYFLLLVLFNALNNGWKACLDRLKWCFYPCHVTYNHYTSKKDTRFVSYVDHGDVHEMNSRDATMMEVVERSHLSIPSTPCHEDNNNNVYNYDMNMNTGSTSSSSSGKSNFAYDAIYPNISPDEVLTPAEVNHLNFFYPNPPSIKTSSEDMIVSYDLIYDTSHGDSIPDVPAATQVATTTAATVEAMNLTDIYPDNNDKVCSPSLVQTPEVTTVMESETVEEDMLLEPSVLFSSPQEKNQHHHCQLYQHNNVNSNSYDTSNCLTDDDLTSSVEPCCSVDVFDSLVVDITVVYDDREVVEQHCYLVQSSGYYRLHKANLETARQ
mmetsp:Transcript_33647/g.46070  ORF Transcript_33647/g.46070 Transcript_33647/m.46070 type:complete len:803 (-) Transcript_33647:33-2441(-)